MRESDVPPGISGGSLSVQVSGDIV